MEQSRPIKQAILILASVLLIASCSQKQFTFRKKITVDKTENLATKPIEKQHTLLIEVNTAVASNDILIDDYKQPLPFVLQSNALSNITLLPDDTIRKKYKFDDANSPSDSLKNNQPNTIQKDPRDTDAMIGFGLALGSLLIVLAAIPGIYFSIRGLKSKKNKGFAIAGLILSVIMTLMLVFTILLFILIIRALGGGRY